jgi:alkyldihydroxyacetonephosphate synthase
MSNTPTLDESTLADLRCNFSGDILSGADDTEVIRHAYDWWPVAAMWRKQGKIPHLPEAVCFPKSKEDAAALLTWADKHRVPLTPWGAGSSVTGSSLPGRGGMTVDFSRMAEVLELNEVDRYVRVEPGIMGDKLEAWLNERGYTLNHSPQSLDRSTPGGWVATFATGQFSSKYGGIEDLLLGLEVLLPDGTIAKTHLTPRTATGPDLRQLFIGAEGTLGLTTEVTLKVFNLAPFRKFSAFEFPDLSSGIRTMREIMQSGLRPFLIRFYDEDEAWHAMKQEGYRKCLLFLGCEGVRLAAEAEFAACAELCALNGAKEIGAMPVEAWMNRRFDFSTVEGYLERPGGYAETIEVAHFWSRIQSLHSRLKQGLHGMATEVMSHFSHVYDQGTSMYMILLGQAPDDAEAEVRLKKIWEITMEICLEEGATIAHHHGAGLARNPYIARERSGDHHLLARIKAVVDPQNLLNPGKLGLPSGSPQ